MRLFKLGSNKTRLSISLIITSIIGIYFFTSTESDVLLQVFKFFKPVKNGTTPIFVIKSFIYQNSITLVFCFTRVISLMYPKFFSIRLRLIITIYLARN